MARALVNKDIMMYLNGGKIPLIPRHPNGKYITTRVDTLEAPMKKTSTNADNILLPNGTRVSKDQFIKQYGQAPWDKIFKSNEDYKDKKFGLGGILKDTGKLLVNSAAAPVEHISSNNFVNFDYDNKNMANAAAISESYIGLGTDAAGTYLLGPGYGVAKNAASTMGSQIGNSTESQKGANSNVNKYSQLAEQVGGSLMGMGTGSFGGANDLANFMNTIQTQAQGGMVNGVQVNVEGGNKQSGYMVNMKKGEYLTNNGKILRNYINIPPHPTNGLNPDGTVNAPEGAVIIPKKLSQEYYDRGMKDRKLMEKSLISKQIKDGRMKNGGMVKPYKYADGGLPFGDFSNPAYPNYVMNWNYAGEPGVYSPGNSSAPWRGSEMSWGQSNLDSLTNIGSYPGMSYSTTTPNTDFKLPAGLNGKTSSQPTQPMKPINFDMNNINKGLAYAPAAYNLGMGLMGKADSLNASDYMVNDFPKWEDINDDESVRAIRDAYNVGNYNLKNSGMYTQSGAIGMINNRMKNIAGTRERLGNLNKQGRYNAAQYKTEGLFRNKATELGIRDINARNKGAKQAFTAEGMKNLGQIGATGNYNNEFFNVLPNLFNNPQFLKYLESNGYKKG